MKNFHYQLLLLFIFFSLKGFAQEADDLKLKSALSAAKEDTGKVNILLQLSDYYLGSDPDEAKSYGIKAMELAQLLKYKTGLALAFKNIGAAYYTLGNYPETISFLGQALNIYDSIGDLDGKAKMLNNIGTVYYNKGEDDKALESYFQSYEVAQKLGDKVRIATALSNIGNVYHNKSATRGQALEYFLKSLKLGEEAGDKNVIGGASVNLGEVYQELNKDDSALFYFQKSLKAYENTVDIPYSLNDIGNVYEKKGDYKQAAYYHAQAYNIAKKFDAKLDMAQSQLGLGRTFLKSKDYEAAVKAYTEAEAISLEISSKKELDSAYAGLANTYYSLNDPDKAYKYQKLYSNLADTLNSLTLADKLTNLQTNFEIVQRQNQINLLTKDKALQDLDLRRQKLARNALGAGLAMIFVIAFILYRNYRIKVKTNKLLDKQKVEIENLLLNILPAEVANELQVNGYATPRYYDSVSVLFTDFKSFTKIADALSPHEVVSELNACFMAFDDIVEKHNLEKIKTIGDAYMIAGGIPLKNDTHPVNIIKAAMEIRDFMKTRNESRADTNMARWDIRIGIHTGPLVAGVVGKKKYAYDIWGSTVNIASRVESNGQEGQINISAATYELIKDKYNCTYRGKISAKNLGEIDMYFVA